MNALMLVGKWQEPKYNYIEDQFDKADRITRLRANKFITLTESISNYKLITMKVLKILLVMLLFVYLLPLGVFCHDSHASSNNETTQDGHCVLMCSATCAHAVTPSISSRSSIQVPNLSLPPSTIALSYQNPFLDSFKRPPITIA